MLFYLLQKLRYLIVARHQNGYGIHPPFLFSLTQNVLTDSMPASHEAIVNKARYLLNKDNRYIETQDFGTGKSRKTSIKLLYRRISIRKKHGRLLHELVQYLAPSSIIELGTGLGISTLYLSTASSATVYTIDGCEETQHIAREQFARLKQNIQTDTLNVSTSKQKQIVQYAPYGLAFIDANHTTKGTLDAFQLLRKNMTKDACIAIHDISLNPGMKKAWKTICHDPGITLSIDLCDLGLVFFNKKLSKQHFIIRY